MKSTSAFSVKEPASTKLMIIDAPGHHYDGRRAILDQVHSERNLATVEIEHKIFAIFPLDQLIPAPSAYSKAEL